MYARIVFILAIAAFSTGVTAQSNRPAMPEGPAMSTKAVGTIPGPKALNSSFVTLSALENQDINCPRTIIGGRVRVTGSVDSGGGFESLAINAWDDGNFRMGVPFSVPVGSTQIYDFSMTYAFPVLQGAAGVGVYLENGVGLAATQTFASNGSLQPTPTVLCPPVGNSITLVTQGIPTLSPIALALLSCMVVAMGMGIFIRRRRR